MSFQELVASFSIDAPQLETLDKIAVLLQNGKYYFERGGSFNTDNFI